MIENAGEGTEPCSPSDQLRADGERGEPDAAGRRRPAGLRQPLVNTIFGNSGNNLLDGGAGADAMSGGAGNDTYFVDNTGDPVIESAGQGNDTVYASVNYGLTANVETLVLQGGADLQGYGNGLRQHRSSAIAATTRSTAAAAPTP